MARSGGAGRGARVTRARAGAAPGAAVLHGPRSSGGLSPRNETHSSTSYEILSPAAATSGADSVIACMASPASGGPHAHAAIRASDVTPAATVRSSGRTTAITYDCRVGTSISTSPSRSRNRVAASGKLGENVELKRFARLAPGGQGRTGGYVHAGGRLGVIVALDTAASGDGLDALAKDVAMHVAAHDPSPVSIDRDGVPKPLLEKETEILRRQAQAEGKPPQVTERIVEGRLKKFYTEVCLLEQAFVKNPDQSVRQLLEEAGKKLGQPVRVTGFVRFKLGETATE